MIKDTAFREIYGSRSYARAKRGSNFYYRMAAWPVAFEEGMKDVCRRHLPVGEYSFYTHGHSTGGPFSHLLLQRVENAKGLIGIENSPFAFIYHKMSGHDWPTTFDHVLVRTWRELARYRGAEVAMQEGEKPLFRLAWLMEEIFTNREGMKDICRRHLPVGEYSFYTHGHSTGGPFSHLLLQRVENAKGLIGIENSPFAFIYHKMSGHDWPTTFDHVLVRTWRELARYRGAEVAMQEGEKPLFRLAWLMEEIFENWNEAKRFPQFKAENWLHIDSHPCLTEAAKVTAERLRLNAEETQALVNRYLGYGRPLTGDHVKPIPPLMYGINKFSRDHTPEKYKIVKAE